MPATDAGQRVAAAAPGQQRVAIEGKRGNQKGILRIGRRVGRRNIRRGRFVRAGQVIGRRV